MYDNAISIKSLCFSSSVSYAIMIGFRVRKKWDKNVYTPVDPCTE